MQLAREMQHAHLTIEFVSLPQVGGIVHIAGCPNALLTSGEDICQAQVTPKGMICDEAFATSAREQLNGSPTSNMW
ncbi:hypothetical protein [Bradyrhizobium sp. Ai1a-2]|uniref:hypothetical protein n=1 Tax=Bradyrhizobium sp. Ai1a-2 TaxID=196490 RepID=UPI0003FCD5B2|nr:hypothetical protein [Bradyrhizobium sp. Ai1a-2]